MANDYRSGGRRGFGPREMHKATCSDCGKECEVPFKPTEGLLPEAPTRETIALLDGQVLGSCSCWLAVALLKSSSGLELNGCD